MIELAARARRRNWLFAGEFRLSWAITPAAWSGPSLAERCSRFLVDGCPAYQVTWLGVSLCRPARRITSPLPGGERGFLVGKDASCVARYDKIHLFDVGSAGRQHRPRIGNGFTRTAPLPPVARMCPGSAGGACHLLRRALSGSVYRHLAELEQSW